MQRIWGKRSLRKFLQGSENIKFLHMNFIDAKIHQSSLDLYPLYLSILDEFVHGILPILKEIRTFTLMADHGFTDTHRLASRYTHGKGGMWETLVPYVKVR